MPESTEGVSDTDYIRYWQASGESLKTSVRTRTRLEQLTGEGHYTGGTVAFGYKRVRLGRVNKKNQEVSITLNASFNQVEQLKSVSIYDGAEIFEEISEKGA